jgi:hypothetical protein
MSAIDTVLDRLDSFKKSGTGFIAKCPAHDDRQASLSITEGTDGKVLLHCFAGCSVEQIVTALGLTLNDLFASTDSKAQRSTAGCTLAAYAAAKHLPIAFLKGLHLTDTRYVNTPVVRIPYLDTQGQEVAVRFRIRLTKGETGDTCFLWKKGDKPFLYGLWRLPPQAESIVLVEGESDSHTLWFHHIDAVGIPGVDCWNEERDSPYLSGIAIIYLVVEPDRGGDTLKEKLSVSVLRDKIQLITLGEHKDPSGLFLADPENFVANWQAAVAKALPYADHEKESWPELADEALYGLVGDIVRTINPYTEADPVSTLINILTAVGNCIGPTPHATVQHDSHPARLFAILVGQTSKGRKGTGWSTPRYLLSLCDSDWTKGRIKSGLSSGEGLIYNVRDPVWKKEPIKEKGRVIEYQDVLADPGESDKRLLILEPEFASTLTVMAREGNILSAVVRQAWDSGNLSPLTRNNPIKATNAYVSFLGHITTLELLVRLDDTSKANGFANRFLWLLVRRSKELPEGMAVPEEELFPLTERLSKVITFARTVTEVKRDADAKALWASVYHDLSEGKPGLLGAVLSRAEAQVLRLSEIYALFDLSAVVRVEHLRAALAVWEFCERSAVLIFGKRLGDPTADRILEALRNAGPAGMSDRDIYELFGRNKSASELARAKNLLLSLRLAKREKEETGGRPRTLWRATC